MAFGTSALPFIAVFIGVILACGIMTWETKTIFTPKLIKAKKPIPEERLPVMIVVGIILVIGLFWLYVHLRPLRATLTKADNAQCMDIVSKHLSLVCRY